MKNLKGSTKNRGVGIRFYAPCIFIFLIAVMLPAALFIALKMDVPESFFCNGGAVLPANRPEYGSEAPLESAILTPRPSPDETEKTEPEFNTITISFVGDCMLASEYYYSGAYYFNKLADEVGPSYFFEGVYSVLSADDWTVANCENVFTDRSLLPVDKGAGTAYWYKSKASNAGIFRAGSVEIVSLANNHTNDFGAEGASDTKAALEAAGVMWGNDGKPIILEKYGYKIALFLVTMYSGYSADGICKQLQAYSESTDYQIVYYHGGTERTYVTDSYRITASHKLVDAGADLVLGAHPHVLQPIEIYNGAVIAHSLGNFIFGGSTRSDNATIIFQQKLTVSEGRLVGSQFKIVPVREFVTEKSNWQPVLLEEGSDGYNAILDFLNGCRETPK